VKTFDTTSALDGGTATVTLGRSGSSSVADRRREALERLHGGDRPGRKADGKRSVSAPAGRIGFWDVQRGPAPAAYYVIGVVVAVFVMLGLVMVLSASAGVEAARGNSPYHIFTRQVSWAAMASSAW
jgi:cell division protein FtsW